MPVRRAITSRILWQMARSSMQRCLCQAPKSN